MRMNKLLLSACLAGNPVRYDGASKPQYLHQLQGLIESGRAVTFCPEVAGGMSVPRDAAEIQNGNGDRVLKGSSRVITFQGEDVTGQFIEGARQALELCQRESISIAVLTEKSPSCGGRQIYDGSFSRTLIDGTGVTAALLKQHGIRVFNESQISEAIACLDTSTDTTGG